MKRPFSPAAENTTSVPESGEASHKIVKVDLACRAVRYWTVVPLFPRSMALITTIIASFIPRWFPRGKGPNLGKGSMSSAFAYLAINLTSVTCPATVREACDHIASRVARV